jgi:murein L,D-transpeptidase YafK
MRRIVIIGLLLAVLVGALFLLMRVMKFEKMRGVAQNVMVKIKPTPEVVRPPVSPLPQQAQQPLPDVVPRTTMPPEPVTPPPHVTPADRPITQVPYAAPPPPDEWAKLNASQRLTDARGRLQPRLDTELSARGFKLGNAAFVRIFKESNEFELWLQPDHGKPFHRFCNYHIALYSGVLGPKTKEGDMQAPEGFYAVAKSQLNPASSYHLSFNIGYPNAYDRSLKRTGSLIMVHGSNVSIGCFAMTDPLIEEIYLIVEAALINGQEQVPVHVFPFRMTEERISAADLSKSEWLEFWMSLKDGYDLFEENKRPPVVSVAAGKYAFHP